MDVSKLCYGCFHESEGHFCPNCGFSNEQYELPALALPLGTILAGRYLTGKVLGQGGFGITYLGFDLVLEVPVAIKEYMPAGLATRASDRYTMSILGATQHESYVRGSDHFLEEARILARLRDVDGIVAVQNHFRENNTAYFVMDYIDGVSLKTYAAQKGGRLSYAELYPLVLPIMRALSKVHEQSLLHRDISPDNIFITKAGKPILLDFGAARAASGGQQSVSIILKHGFAPIEQYSTHGNQGPWTDVYSMGALFYALLSGRMPEESVRRMQQDNLASLSSLGVNLPANAESAILKALSVNIEDRFQSMEAFVNALPEPGAAPGPVPGPIPGPAPTPGDSFWTRLVTAFKTKPALRWGTIGGAALLVVLCIAIPLIVNATKDRSVASQGGDVDPQPSFSATATEQPTPATPTPAPTPEVKALQLDYDESGSTPYTFPEAQASFLYKAGLLAVTYPEDQSLYIMDPDKDFYPVVGVDRYDPMSMEEFEQMIDDWGEEKADFTKGEQTECTVNGIHYTVLNHSYTDEEDGTLVEYVLARDEGDLGFYTVTSIQKEGQDPSENLGLVAGSLQPDAAAYASLSASKLDADAAYLYPSQYELEDESQLRLVSGELFPYVFVRNYLSTYTTEKFRESTAEIYEVSEITERVIGGRLVETFESDNAGYHTLYVSLPHSEKGIYTLSVHVKEGDDEGFVEGMGALETILQTWREDSSAYDGLSFGANGTAAVNGLEPIYLSGHGLSLSVPAGATCSDLDSPGIVSIRIDDSAEFLVAFTSIEASQPLYSLEDASTYEDDLIESFKLLLPDGFAFDKTYDDTLNNQAARVFQYNCDKMESGGQGSAFVCLLESMNGYGLHVVTLICDNGYTPSVDPDVYWQILNSTSIEAPAETDYALFESEDLSLKCLYHPSLLTDEIESYPERDDYVAVSYFYLESPSRFFLEDAEGYASSKEDALDTVESSLYDAFSSVEMYESGTYTFGDNTYSTREYTFTESGTQNYCALACTELDGRLVMFCMTYIEEHKGDAQTILNTVLCTLRPL